MPKAAVFKPEKFCSEWWSRKVALCLGLVSSLPLLGMIFGFQFVPRVGWISYGYWISIPVAVFVGFIASSAVRKNWRLQKTEDQMRVFPIVEFSIIGSALLLVSTGLPVGAAMVYSALVREPVQHDFVIARSDFENSRYCSREVKLRGLPILYDRICRAPTDMEYYVTNGRKISLIGFGSSLGVFPQDIEIGK